MNIRDHLDGLEFDDDKALDDQVGTEALLERNIIVDDRNWNLPLDRDSTPIQLELHHPFVNRFQ